MVREITFFCLAGGLTACAMNGFDDLLSPEDRTHMAVAVSEALEGERTGEGRTWQNPLTGHRGTVTVLQTWQDDGQPCREYQSLVTIGQTTRAAYGESCRQASGDWAETYAATDFRQPGYPYQDNTAVTFGMGFGHYPAGIYHPRYFGPYPWYGYGYGYGPYRPYY
jgi:surface antigen